MALTRELKQQADTTGIKHESITYTTQLVHDIGRDALEGQLRENLAHFEAEHTNAQASPKLKRFQHIHIQASDPIRGLFRKFYIRWGLVRLLGPSPDGVPASGALLHSYRRQNEME